VHGIGSPRRTLLLTALAALLGLLGGAAGWLLLRLIGLFTQLFLFHRVGWTIPSFAGWRPGWGLVVAGLAGGFAIALLARWAPMIRGHGIPEAMEAILTRESRIAPRNAIAKPLSAAIAIGTGGPFGAEGPIIVTGGALGSLLGQLLHVSPAERKILLASGAAAGMAATFGTPLAAVVLPLELLVFEFSTRAFVPLVVAASIAAGVHSLLLGPGPLFAVPARDYAGLSQLPFYALLGVACGGLAVLICKGLFVVERGFQRLPVSEFWHPVLGSLGFVAVGLLVPRALGVGYSAIGDVLAGRLGLAALATLLVAKLLAWWLALGSGTSGGTLAPVLLIAGCWGGLLGTLLHAIVPGAGLDPGGFALVAMAATFGAATRATFTSIVFLFELTGDLRVILPLMLASVIADLLAASLLRESLMTEKLARRGLRVSGDYQVDVLATTTVGEVMSRPVESLRADATVAEARRRLLRGGHGAYPLVDASGRCRGMVSRSDLLSPELNEDQSALSAVARDAVSVATTTSLLEALHRIVDERREHLLVLDDGQLVGICTRTDILRARHRHAEAERRQRGWLGGGRRADRLRAALPTTTTGRKRGDPERNADAELV
jgi:chloride channel protein, CIC family